MPTIVTCLYLGAAAAWTVFWLQTVSRFRRTPRLEDRSAPVDGRVLVSILVPARNEASRLLERSIRSMLAVDWPRLEVIAVDDRSTDATGAILERLAGEGSRLRVIHGSEPPDGWAGKVHALWQAQQQARGDWILGTDADMVFEPGVLRGAMALAAEARADVVTLIPDARSSDRLVRLVLPVAFWMITRLYPPTAANNPRDARALGCGGFLLMRRAALEAVGGYRAVAGEVVDDVGLARAIKHAGFRLWCAAAPEFVWTPMYESAGELFEGFAKNAYAGLRRRWWYALGVVLIDLLGAVTLPAAAAGLLCLAAHQPEWMPAALCALTATATMTGCLAEVYREAGMSRWHALATPVAFAFMGAVVAESARRGVLGRTTPWRGRDVRH